MNIGLLKQTAITQLHSFITKYLSMQTMHELRSTLHSSSTIVRHFFGCLSDIFRYFRYCRRFRNDFRIFRRFHEGFSIFRRFSDRNYHFSKLRSSCAKLIALELRKIALELHFPICAPSANFASESEKLTSCSSECVQHTSKHSEFL